VTRGQALATLAILSGICALLGAVMFAVILLDLAVLIMLTPRYADLSQERRDAWDRNHARRR
jgi:hypothetical protein